jgi:hypothetical protein
LPHVAGHPSPSHHHHPIIVVQLPLSNRHHLIATIVFIDSVAVSGGGGIVAVAIAIATAVATSNIADVAVIVHVHPCCPIFVVQSPLSNLRPRIAAIAVSNILAVGDGCSGSIIAVTIAAAVAITVAASAIAIVAVIVGVHFCCPIVVVLLLSSNHRP